MEISVSSIVGAIVVVTLMTCALKLVNWVWLRPKKLEKGLKKQGLKGNSYKLLFGDLKESSSMTNEAKSRTIGLSDDIVPHILPFVSHNIEKYGEDFFTWFGPTPSVNIMNPQLIREVLGNYKDFHQLSISPLVKLLADGIMSLEGEKWVRRRKIINPAFHVEKLKVIILLSVLHDPSPWSIWWSMLMT